MACVVRDEWLRHGLSTGSADRPVAEAAVTELYRHLDEPPPEFVWVLSPEAALAAAKEAVPDLRPLKPRLSSDWPLAGRLANLLASARDRMDARVLRGREQWANRGHLDAAMFLPPEEALAAGVRLDTLARVIVRDALHATLVDGVGAAIRTAMPSAVDSRLGIAWYGQQEAFRVGYYDALRRSGLVTFGSEDRVLLDLQAELARATGWWWSLGRVCVMAERPVELHTEPAPEARHGELRLHHGDSPALRFGDDAHAYVLHGAVVPDWVVLDPTAERIHAERNVEVRRTAIERLGWETYIEQAELKLLGSADDPGNPGATLHLYDTPPTRFGNPTRLLLVVNGSVERDGTRRRYGLHVSPALEDPLSAAGWTYGLSGEQYAQLVRRT